MQDLNRMKLKETSESYLISPDLNHYQTIQIKNNKGLIVITKTFTVEVSFLGDNNPARYYYAKNLPREIAPFSLSHGVNILKLMNSIYSK